MHIKYFKHGTYHAIFLATTALFSRGLLFLFLPYFLSKLTIAEFGVWDFYQHFLSFGTMVISSGATMALTRFYSYYSHDPVQQKATVGNACLAVIVATVALCLFGPACALFFPATASLSAMIMVTVLFSFFYVVLTYLRIVEQLWRYAFVFCVQSLVALGLSALGLHYHAGIMGLFYAYGVSLAIFLPLFCSVAYQHRSYSWPLFKEQVRYSAPLLVYNIISLGFFTLDRLYLARVDQESLGVYALLWKFGALYQFCALSLTNAVPLVIFQAHQEKKDNPVIALLVTSVCTVLLVGSIVSVYATQYALGRWFPDYAEAQTYVPLFFTFLGVLEVAKMMQTGFHLAVKTVYIPMVALLMLGLQACSYLCLYDYCLWGVCCANTCTFMVYAVLSCVVGYRMYACHIVDYQRLIAVMSCFMLTMASMAVRPMSPVLVLLAWLGVLWFVMPRKEKVSLSPLGSPAVRDHEYSTGIEGKRIALFGPYPPPLGGIAVHVQRVGFKFREQGNTVLFFDTEQRCSLVHYFVKVVRFLCSSRCDLAYYHTPYQRRGLFEFFLLAFLQNVLKFKLVFVEHDAQQFKKQSGVRYSLFLWSIGQVQQVVFIGNTPYESYQNSNIVPKFFSIESAFLPPDLMQEDRILATYPHELFGFLAARSTIILVNAFQLRLVDGVDVYGYDMCIELLRRVRQTDSDVGLVFALASVGNQDYYERMCKRVSELDLSSNIYIVHGQKELWPLFKCATLFVRPTLFDNYGISVAEALYFGIPAVASDVCVRPAGTTLFRKRDFEDFYCAVTELLRKQTAYKGPSGILSCLEKPRQSTDTAP